jgi:hypothetical protein
LAISASTRASRSPPIMARSITRADTVVTDHATVDSLIEASSNISSKRTASRVRSPISCTRYRVSIRNRRIGGGGTNEGDSSPCSRSWAIHSASRTSVLRPGTAFMCAAFSSQTSIDSSRQ